MRTLLILIAFSFTLGSCTTYQYVSSKQTVPLFSKKNDLKAEIVISPFNTCSADIAYSVSNHIGIFCNANYYKKSYGPNEFLIGETGCFLKSRIVDFNSAVGYFNHTNRINYEIFSGIGYGTNEYINIDYYYPDGINIGPNDSLFFNSKMYKFFIQPDISLKFKNNFQIALATKFSINDYNLLNKSKLEAIENAHYAYGTTFYNYFQGKQSIIIYNIEPSITLSEGAGFVKFQQQIIAPAFISNNKVNYHPVCFYLSLLFDIPELSQKPNKSAARK
jgi:hypothetical protein